MPKYSPDRSGGTESSTCELCGKPAETLTDATIAGAQLVVCPDCVPHDEGERTRSDTEDQAPVESKTNTPDQETPSDPPPSDRETSRQGTSPLWDSDTSHWEEGGVEYDSDRLPYLVSDYGTRIQTAREAAGLTREEVAADLTISEQDLLVIEQGDAVTVGIGGTTITALEDYFDIRLTE